jgi:oxygen-independent coproporphyrinogen III oxidase
LDKQGKKYQKMKKIDSLYLHVPYCTQRCNYCDFYHLREAVADLDAYEQYLLTCWSKHQELLSSESYYLSDLANLYLGGGTPALWGERGAEFLFHYLERGQLGLQESCECTLELNPEVADLSKLVSAWKQFGVNRFSVGVQSTRHNFLGLLGRSHTEKDIFDALTYLAAHKLNYSVDLMLGLPYSKQFQREVTQELERVLEFSPPHLSIYILTVKKNYRHHATLPDDEWIRREYLGVAQLLVERGYDHYEVSSFALPGFQSGHNLEYWQQHSVAALGPSASGFLLGDGIQTGGLRYRWAGYPSNPSLMYEKLSVNQLQLERIYMNMRSNIGLDPSLEFDVKGLEVFNSTTLPGWHERGYLRNPLHARRVVLSTLGYLMLDSLIEDLYPLLPE